ncbi:brain I3 [Pelobates cultripes]|uniref:Brain I3 n=1 Tax=Pelobates cultripes TaxID=61616 RepID=A0AAD1WFE9_PELCU|nr:brain I3 [Pelobates cultripes]
MDSKPLLQDRPPAYSPPVQGVYDHGQQNYGTIPGAPMAGAPTVYPPVYPQSSGTGYISPPQQTYPTSYTIIQQPATTTTSVVVVGGCPACRRTIQTPFKIEERT